MENEKVIEVKPIRTHYFIGVFLFSFLGLVMLVYFKSNANEILGLSSFSKSTIHALMRNALTFGPSAAMFYIAFFICAPKLMLKWRIDRKFIQEISNFGGITTIDTCDMHKVDDVKLTNFGLFSDIKITTRDASSPVIKIKNIRNAEATEVFNFINEMAVNSVTERLNRKK